ncbi:MAG: hypothetical protein D6704_01230 [Nitrospirae bacterium]|nr:MAG: hypothetical protein D6704_01230 [Nitrospirota bacterium]
MFTRVKQAILSLIGVLYGLMPQLAFAEGVGGSYKGIATMYYMLIAAVLIYGVYDIFGKKVTMYAGPVIAIAMYLLIPDV